MRGEDLLDRDRVKPGARWGGVIHCCDEFIGLGILRFGELVCIVLCVENVNKVVVFVEEQ